MNKLVKGILIGFISALLTLSTTIVFAQTIKTELKKIIFKVDGKQISSITNGISYNNQIYVSANNLSKSLNYVYTFNQKTNTIDFKSMNNIIPDQTSQYKLKYILFYESGYDNVDNKFRAYKTEFPQSISRYICWEIGITSGLSSKNRNLALKYVYYNPDGSIYGTSTSEADTFIVGKNTTDNVFSWGLGASQHGTWDVGTYKVELFIDGIKLTTSSFKIVDDSKSIDEKTKYLASTKILDYTDILRNPSKYKDVNVEFYGKVLTINELGDNVQMYVNLSDIKDKYEIMSLRYTKKADDTTILIGDKIEFWGAIDGVENQEVDENKVVIPIINVKYFNIYGEE